MRAKAFLASIAILLCTAGCARKPETAAHLCSEFRRVTSSAADAELFVERLKAGSIPHAFARTHAAYLADDVMDAQKNPEKTSPVPGLAEAQNECKRLQKLLLDQLNLLPAHFDDPVRLAAVQQRIGEIRKDSGQRRGCS
jgi:hypothetical protein